MKKDYKIFINLLLIGTMHLPANVFAGQDQETQHQHHHAGKAQDNGNPLIEEMMLLDTAFREIVSAVAVGDGSRVLKALEPMHGAMEKTHEGVHEGAVRIPKNADRVKEFMKMDKQFHEDLESLASASGKNDKKAMLDLTKKLLDGCVSCHQGFRN
jgi:cytochrome c556